MADYLWVTMDSLREIAQRDFPGAKMNHQLYRWAIRVFAESNGWKTGAFTGERKGSRLDSERGLFVFSPDMRHDATVAELDETLVGEFGGSPLDEDQLPHWYELRDDLQTAWAVSTWATKNFERRTALWNGHQRRYGKKKRVHFGFHLFNGNQVEYISDEELKSHRGGKNSSVFNWARGMGFSLAINTGRWKTIGGVNKQEYVLLK